MAISFVGAQGAAAATVTIPAHQVGDLILIFAYRDGSNTAPTTPTAGGTVPTWNLIGSSGSNTNSSNFRWAKATTTTTTSGTWTNATELICLVYRKASIGASAGNSGATTTTINYPAVTLNRTDGSSWVVGVAGHRTATNVEIAPTGMTNRASSGTEAAGHDTNSGVSSWTSQNVTVNASSAYRSWVVELEDTELDLTGTTGTFTLSGTTTGFNLQKQLNLTAGIFALSGTTTGLLFNRRLDQTTGLFTFAGTTTGLLSAFQLISQLNQFTLTGNNTLLTRILRVDGQVGQFTLNGVNIDLDFVPAAGLSLDCITGSLTWVGLNVDLNLNRVLATVKGEYAVVGVPLILLNNHNLTATTLPVNLIGQDIAFSRQLLLNLGADSFVLGSTNTDFARLYQLNGSKGQILVSSSDITLLQNRLLNTTTNEFSLFTLPGIVVKQFPLNTTGSVFTLNANDLDYFASRILNAQKGNLDLYIQPRDIVYRPNREPVFVTPVPQGRNQWILGKFTSGGKGSFRV